jgi:cephalosporin hydroxylase
MYDSDFGHAPLPDDRPSREEVKLMMEVGVADGSSLLAWCEIFPNALCVGMDIHHSDKAHGERIEFHLGDQHVQADCERAAAGRQFDMIVEDATHKLEDTLLTLFYLWPSVRPGGLYVVEEWYCGNSPDVQRVIKELWPFVQIVKTSGPHIDDEPLIVFRKPL